MPDQACRVVGIGELVWDLLPAGPRLGGAPFNTVAHLARFGCAAAYVTAVGSDDLGQRALEEIRRLGVRHLARADLGPPDGRRAGATSTRPACPHYEIVSPAAYEAIVPLDGDALELASRADVLVFGTLAQRFPGPRDATRQVIEAAARAVRLYDVNLRPGCWDADARRASSSRWRRSSSSTTTSRPTLADALDLPGVADRTRSPGPWRPGTVSGASA